MSNTIQRTALSSIPSWHVSLDAAIDTARLAANVYGLPQTVFQTAETCGWANTNSFASFLSSAEVHVTMLPYNYFA